MYDTYIHVSLSIYVLWILQWNEELIGEIAELDTEILQLERYLLSLYRSSFGDHLPDNSSLPPCTTKFHNDQASSVSDKSVLSRLKQFSKTVSDDLNLMMHILV